MDFPGYHDTHSDHSHVQPVQTMATPTVGVEDDQAPGKTVGEVFVKQFSCILFRKVNIDKDGLS